MSVRSGCGGMLGMAERFEAWSDKWRRCARVNSSFTQKRLNLKIHITVINIVETGANDLAVRT